jgi:predicted Zn-dependent protease
MPCRARASHVFPTSRPPARRRGHAVALALAAGLAVGCTTAPYTQRRQLILMSPQEEQQLGATAFQEVLEESRVDRDPRFTKPVVEVGERIAAVADRPDYRWQFVVIADAEMPNAFALPGGKVAVYTGLFPIARTTAGLAVVMGHEIAHAIARHGAERASQQVLAQTGGAVLGAAVGSQGVMQAYGLGAQVGLLLPWSRQQESEADHIGLILMAKAGYDPREAIDFWQRMRQAGTKEAIEFLSTHPGHETREQRIREWLPEALRYYEKAEKAPVTPLPQVAVPAAASR